MTGADRRDVDGGAWRTELEGGNVLHLANVVDQACAWAREFHVRTGDELWEGSSLVSYPLIGYADRLERIRYGPKDAVRERIALSSSTCVGSLDDACALADSGAWVEPELAIGRLLGRRPVRTHASAHFAARAHRYRAGNSGARNTPCESSAIERELGMPQLVKYTLGWLDRISTEPIRWCMRLSVTVWRPRSVECGPPGPTMTDPAAQQFW